MKRARQGQRKLFMAVLGTETNSYSPMPTGIDLFNHSTLMRRGGTFISGTDRHLFYLPLNIWRSRAEAQGWDVVEGIATLAMPAGETTAKAFGSSRTRF